MVCAVIGLAFAYFLIVAIMRHSAGNEKMREISAAVQEGAKAYLNRQVKTISVIAVAIFILLFVFKDHATAIGFVIGAFCSLAAGFIGMRVAVLANVRTTQAALDLGLRHDVELPIAAQIADVLAGRKDARTALKDLMVRPQRAEVDAG